MGGGGEKELPAGGIRASQGTFSSFNKHRVISPFSDMTLHFYYTTTTGF